MPNSPEEEYELLPTTEVYTGVDNDGHIPRFKRRSQKLSFVYRHPKAVLFTSIAFFIGALIFMSYDILYLKAKLAITGSYNAFLHNLWPVGLPNRTDMWENENSKSMQALLSCMSTDTCTQNQTSIVLLSSMHFANSISGHVSGEDIWASSVLDALRDMGYTCIFTNTNEELARTYRQYPDLVKIVILEGSASHECFKSEKCIKKPTHPLGIPAWKMFSFHFWGGAENPLGNAWTLSPENYGLISPGNSKDNIYLGYSIERQCMQIPVTPMHERPRQAYILAKQSRYFYGNDYAWPNMTYDDPPFDVNIVAGIAMNNSEPGQVLPSGIVDYGRLTKEEFYAHLGKSRVLVGIGKPTLSPSPYDALCMGLSFINPIMSWAKDDPENRTRWQSQHDALKFLDPPYVYNVRKGHVEAFWSALGQALDAQIDRYIVPQMTMEALKYRVARLVEGNWKEKAIKLLEERKATGKGEYVIVLFYLWIEMDIIQTT
ncbi:hypothetical protein BDN70DRAFT_922288 [Pholiota conissans]|uniref:alpha-1,6-mannosyl-glycoprotein 6-beta-N-acetylglucosaminyltransferase n=1 Tax=Pholiota conissans TaxID=109636 RepID=A0A9P5YZ46_9AGAR|nr:hypothetical protein BDN70DRAFT_922288 [Pholiota conissans]